MRMTLKLKYTTESQEQVTRIQWDNKHKNIGAYLIHIHNGGYRRPLEARHLKYKGVVKKELKLLKNLSVLNRAIKK